MTTTPPYPTVPLTPRTNGVAIAALVTGLCGLALIPVVLGHVALNQIRRSGEGGSALAVVGLVLGYGTLALYAVVITLTIWGGVWIWTS